MEKDGKFRECAEGEKVASTQTPDIVDLVETKSDDEKESK